MNEYAFNFNLFAVSEYIIYFLCASKLAEKWNVVGNF